MEFLFDRWVDDVVGGGCGVKLGFACASLHDTRKVTSALGQAPAKPFRWCLATHAINQPDRFPQPVGFWILEPMMKLKNA